MTSGLSTVVAVCLTTAAGKESTSWVFSKAQTEFLGLLKSPNWIGGLHGRRKVYLSFLTSLHGRRLHIQPFSLFKLCCLLCRWGWVLGPKGCYKPKRCIFKPWTSTYASSRRHRFQSHSFWRMTSGLSTVVAVCLTTAAGKESTSWVFSKAQTEFLGLLKSPNWIGGLHGRRKVYLSFLTSLHGRRLHIQPFSLFKLCCLHVPYSRPAIRAGWLDSTTQAFVLPLASMSSLAGG